MKLYDRNIVQKRFSEHARSKVSDRDAVVWSVDTNNYTVLVKIQGSNTLVKAHFPRNWKTIPVWLKVGNSVRVRHRSGDQGFIEVIGHGRAIPTPVEGDLLPRPPVPGDALLSGMLIMAHATGGMNIYVTAGTYRINGIVYSYLPPVTGYVVMDDPPEMTMGLGTVMGYGGAITPTTISDPPENQTGRYDLLCIGADGVIDIIEGVPASLSLEPYKPALPPDHVKIGYLFIWDGMNEIGQEDVGNIWTLPKPLDVTIETDCNWMMGELQFGWDIYDDTPVKYITYTTRDQYGWPYPLGVNTTLEWIGGTGGVGTSALGPFGSSASLVMGSSVTFYYERNQLADPEKIGVLYWVVDFYHAVRDARPLVLMDFFGVPVGGP